MVHIAIPYHSGYGHTEAVAKSVAAGAQSAGATAVLIAVDKITDADWQTLDAADGIIFGSPTYMGSVSGPFKVFMDATSKVWFGQKWKNKIAAGFTNSGGLSGDKLNTLQQLSVLSAQHQMIWVSLGVFPSSYTNDGRGLNRLGSWLGLMTQATNDSPATTPPPEDHDTAREFGKRVAEATTRWKKGA